MSLSSTPLFAPGRTLVIAEAGVNHNGSLSRAFEMVDAAAEAGADYIKFQTFKAEALVTARARQAAYQLVNCGGSDGSQLEMLRRLELDEAAHRQLIDRCRERGIGFMSSAFDPDSVEFLSSLKLDFWKVPSGEITNLPFLRRIAADGLPVVLSTGMSTLDEVADAVNALEEAGLPRSRVVLLHCTTEYPAPFASVNLRAMSQALASLGCAATGYSDHTPGIEIALAAAALGAAVVEKHFTLSRSLPGPDHKASLEPAELKTMVEGIHHIRQAMGSGTKQVAEAERPNITAARKSIVAARPIVKGTVITPADLACKRPATGLSPMLWDTVVGSTACRDFAPDEPLTLTP